MKTRNLTYLITGAGLMLAASPLLAAEVDNINVPTSPGEHAYFGSIIGNRASGPGDTVFGDGILTGIIGGPGLCASGSSCTLTYEFSGFELERVVGNTGFFSGGQVTFTANGSETFLTAEADFLPADSSTSVDDTLYTLVATKTTGDEQNGAFGVLSVTGGDAFSLFNNNTYDNGGSGLSDLLFNTSWSPNDGDDEDTVEDQFGGSIDVHYTIAATPVPEPSELGMLVFGLALIGGGLAFRRRKNV